MPAELPPLSVAGRIDRVRAEMIGIECDALAVHDLTSIRWCTGFTGSSALLVVTENEATLITDGRYETQIAQQLEMAESSVRRDLARSRQILAMLVKGRPGE